MRTILRLRKMDRFEREEHEALVDVYKAALGMLDGTPLGQAAVRRLTSEPNRPPSPDEANSAETLQGADSAPEKSGRRRKKNHTTSEGVKQPEAVTPEMVAEAREVGRASAHAGRPVTANPYPPLDPRRAAFDEGWCQATGSDGMDIPEAFRRRPKEKRGRPDEPVDAAEGASGEGEGEGEGSQAGEGE
jgi:hypothetical protein